MNAVYVVCESCQEGRLDPDGSGESQKVREYGEHHAKHGKLEIVAEASFLSLYLRDGYVDHDNPDREPLPIEVNVNRVQASRSLSGKALPYGAPGDIQRSLRIQRRLRAGVTGVTPSRSESEPTQEPEPKPVDMIDLTFIRPGLKFSYEMVGDNRNARIVFEGQPAIWMPIPLAHAMLKELLP